LSTLEVEERGVSRRLVAPQPRSRWSSALLDPLLLPGALAFAVFAAFDVLNAGWAPTVWYPGALFLLFLAVVTLPLTPRRRASLAAVAAIALLTAFTGWSFLSIWWADVKGDAWDGANRTLLYLVVYVLFVRLPWRATAAALLLGGYALAVAVMGAVELARAASAADPTSYFLLGRFAAPAGYQNADCALFLMAFWPALHLSSSRAVPATARALLLAASGVTLELALLIQSRATVVAFPLTLALYLAFVPSRARRILFGLAPAVATAFAAPTLLHVFTAIRDDVGIRSSVADARDTVLISALVLLVVGLAAALVDARASLGPKSSRLTSRALGGAFAAAAVVAITVGIAAAGGPTKGIEHAWSQFKNSRGGSSSSYFANGLGGNRYDIYRVALDEFRASPVRGVGADNFAVGYLRERRSLEEPLYPHSLELRLLTQTGVIGTLLFAGFLAAALFLLLPLRRSPPLERGVAVAATTLFAYWLIHGSVDWFWELPGLAGPAFASLGLATGIAGRGPPEAVRRSRVLVVPAAAFVCVAALSLALPWLAAKEVQDAARGWLHDPADAYRRLDRARSLNPLSERADLVAGAIASRLGDRRRMHRSFERAIDRNPHNWYAWLELGVVQSLQGQKRAALASLARAHALDPREGTIADVADDVRSGRRVVPAQIDRAMLRAVAVDTVGRRR
jgi:O-antigen ligase